ncbi:MAG: hypothetical protein ACE5JK_07245 [Candidatus Omnitrophota bacterium]
MKVKMIFCITIIALMVFMTVSDGFAQRRRKSSSDLLREGLLGAGAGAVGGAASGAKGGDIWKGALAGAGVNIVGGALLDSMSGDQVDTTQRIDSVSPRTAYSDGYEAGYQNGYKQGYTEGYKDGLKESYKER